jgi:uncharacterized membrane protein YfcA
MQTGSQPIPWRAIARGGAIVYGITFLSGLLFAFNGVTPQNDRIAYPLLALLAGAVGIAIALWAANITKLTHVALLGVGTWLLNATSVLIGAQSFTGWLESSFFVCMTLMLGWFMVGTRPEPMPPSKFANPHSVPRRASTTQAHGSNRPAL